MKSSIMVPYNKYDTKENYSPKIAGNGDLGDVEDPITDDKSNQELNDGNPIKLADFMW